jgi:hypothetical protein
LKAVDLVAIEAVLAAEWCKSQAYKPNEIRKLRLGRQLKAWADVILYTMDNGTELNNSI